MCSTDRGRGVLCGVCAGGEPREGEYAADEGPREAPDVVGRVEAAQEGHVLLPARGKAAGGEGVAEAAQAAGEVMWRSRVGLCDDAARQGAVPPRFHTPRVLQCVPRMSVSHPLTGAQVRLVKSDQPRAPRRVAPRHA